MNEERLSEVLVEFARTLVTDFPIQAILDRLVGRVLEVVPVTGAGVLLLGGDAQLHFVAATDDTIREIETLQLELGEGPCLESFATGDRVALPDLQTDRRFPRFSPRALQAGLRAVYTFPLRMDGHRLGALDLYCTGPGCLAENDLVGAQVLADVAAAYLINARSRAEVVDAAQRSEHRALHDALTGLPNRALLSDRLRHALLRAPRAGSQVALLFLDLDRFKAVNDLHGHAVGDDLLLAVTERVAALLRPGDTLARLAGDEFVVLCEDLPDSRQAEDVAARLVRALGAPFALPRALVVCGASIGVACTQPGVQSTPDVDRIAEDLLRQADLAMYQAKSDGGGRYALATHASRAEGAARHTLERDLPAALAGAGLHLAYQPIRDLRDEEWVGVEALLRWDHPDLGPVPAVAVVAAAERTGLMPRLGRWVLAQACADLAGWRATPGLRDERFSVAVNVSPTELLDPTYPTQVAEVLHRHQLPPQSLCLEVTESVLVEDAARTLTALDALKRTGVLLALDDFGTGYSSLTHLRQFPVDLLKIDRSFVAALTTPDATGGTAGGPSDPHPLPGVRRGTGPVEKTAVASAIVTAVVHLAHALGLTVVVEGVETPEQLAAVRAHGCDRAQGDHITPATARERLPHLL